MVRDLNALHLQVWVFTKLPTYPSPYPTFYLKWEIGVNVQLGEGWVGIPPRNLQYSSQILKHLCDFPLPQCWFGYYSRLTAPKYAWLNIGEGEGQI